MKLKEVWAAAFLLLLPTTVMAEDLIRIGLFNKDAVIIAAQEKGLLKAENIRVEINTVTDSPTLLRNLISGRYDLILNNADNVIAWAEGQGADPQKNDFVIFLGGSQGVNQRLAVHPSINDYNDIKGKVLAVDAPTTGYAIVMIAILKKHGLELNRGEWANAHEDLLVRFIRAMIRTTDWVMDGKNREEVIKLLLAENKNNRSRAEEAYEESISPRFGFTPRSRIDIEGIRTIIELRETAGLMKPPVPKPEKYVDERFYKKALASLDR